jgi:hypothetical protein
MTITKVTLEFITEHFRHFDGIGDRSMGFIIDGYEVCHYFDDNEPEEYKAICGQSFTPETETYFGSMWVDPYDFYGLYSCSNETVGSICTGCLKSFQTAVELTAFTINRKAN